MPTQMVRCWPIMIRFSHLSPGPAAADEVAPKKVKMLILESERKVAETYAFALLHRERVIIWRKKNQGGGHCAQGGAL